MSDAATFQSAGPDETRKLGEKLGRLAEAGDVVVLSGELGTGKTTFVQGLAVGMGVREHVQSPSFTLVHPHPGRLPLYHIDLYRIERPEELADLGLDEVLGADGVAAVEWGDRFESLFEEGALFITLGYEGGQERRRTLQACPRGERARTLLAEWVAGCSA